MENGRGCLHQDMQLAQGVGGARLMASPLCCHLRRVGKGWCNAGYIFPEGFHSRTLFRSSGRDRAGRWWWKGRALVAEGVGSAGWVAGGGGGGVGNARGGSELEFFFAQHQPGMHHKGTACPSSCVPAFICDARPSRCLLHSPIYPLWTIDAVAIDQLCVHECTIIGKDGEYWPAPTFKVVALDRPDEPLIAKSCTGCWTGVSAAQQLWQQLHRMCLAACSPHTAAAMAVNDCCIFGGMEQACSCWQGMGVLRGTYSDYWLCPHAATAAAVPAVTLHPWVRRS